MCVLAFPNMAKLFGSVCIYLTAAEYVGVALCTTYSQCWELMKSVGK